MEATIKLKIKKIEIELTEEEAKELKDILERLTGGERVIQRDISYPWYYPWWIETPRYNRWEITCDSTVDLPVTDEPVTVCYKS